MRADEEYLGDGLYASFDGFAIVLRAPRDGGEHWVALEPEVYAALKRYADRVWYRKQKAGGA